MKLTEFTAESLLRENLVGKTLVSLGFADADSPWAPDAYGKVIENVTLSTEEDDVMILLWMDGEDEYGNDIIKVYDCESITVGEESD